MGINKVYYNQKDNRWINYPYPAPGYENATIGSGGCAPTCAAMVISSAKEIITPDDMGDISRENGFRVSGGTRAELFSYIADRWNLEYQKLYSSYEAFNYCKSGWFVVILCSKGLWTTGGHYILAVGTRDNQIEIFDPNLYEGKFDILGRQGKVSVEGVSCFVQIDTFKRYSNAQYFYAIKIPPAKSPEPDEITINDYLNMELYTDMYPDLKKEFGYDFAKLKEHFYTYGINEPRIASYVFDKDFYLDRYEDIRKVIGGDSYQLYNHFAKFGIKESRSGGILYDPDLYFDKYEDLRNAFGGKSYNLLLHFLRFGMNEKRLSSYVFDPVYYFNKYEDIRNTFGKAQGYTLFKHFLTDGIKEGRESSIIFDIKTYKANYEDLRGKSNLEVCYHFINHGMKEGRIASKDFNVQIYKDNNEDLRREFGENMVLYYKHFLIYGQYEHRKHN